MFTNNTTNNRVTQTNSDFNEDNLIYLSKYHFSENTIAYIEKNLFTFISMLF
jgi:hypothetical protein